MPSHASDVDVLIVGAGPVGLFLANECARRGLSFRLIEARASQSEHSKALAIFPRTLEILDMAGLADPFLETANRVTERRPFAGTCAEHPQATRTDWSRSSRPPLEPGDEYGTPRRFGTTGSAFDFGAPHQTRARVAMSPENIVAPHPVYFVQMAEYWVPYA